MFYVEFKKKIVLYDENVQRLQNTLLTKPEYQGCDIKETQEGYTIVDGELITFEEKEKRDKQAERARLDKLSMTRGDVFEALILAKGLGKTQIRAMIEKKELDDITKALYLNRFDEALEFYRGYPIFDMLGEVLGITSDMLDRFFETKDYHELVTKEAVNENTTDTTIHISNEVEEEKFH